MGKPDINDSVDGNQNSQGQPPVGRKKTRRK